ncbi:hypothetical protein COB55_05170 [Candidatus Wolfebacteria bacterium]|nr:MAG: hypothetical protein COB55_05170 [Candidatus Wolfebacteria bacterium]
MSVNTYGKNIIKNKLKMKTFIQTSTQHGESETTIHKSKDLKTFIWDEHVSFMENELDKDDEDDMEELQEIKDDPIKHFDHFNGEGGFDYVIIYELKNDKLKLVFPS